MSPSGHPFTQSVYRGLPAAFFVEVAPQPAPAPRLAVLNEKLAQDLGIDAGWLASPEFLAALSGAAPPQGMKNIALAYAGHQFGHWNPLLGDGRAVMIGEIAAPDGLVYDVQLKGSGRTPFSRGGDGRATLSAMLREYIVSEAMAGLNIPTTRSLAVLTSGEDVFRESVHPGAVLTRVAKSHLRVGSFQYAANEDARNGAGPALTRALADCAIARNFPELAAQAGAGGPALYLAFFETVVARQAALIARWMLVGFIHGVMNTDNMSIAGETIDFGPCAFLDAFSLRRKFSSIDEYGRYAYGAQPQIGVWNLARLAEALAPLFDDEPETAVDLASEKLKGFASDFEKAFAAGMAKKLGLRADDPGTPGLVAAALRTMERTGVDFTLFFRALTRVAGGASEAGLLAQFAAGERGDAAIGAGFLERWRAGFAGEGQRERVAAMRAANPIFIARNHRVEQALAAANESGDFAPFNQLCAVLARPFDEQPENVALEAAPAPQERVVATFCGT